MMHTVGLSIPTNCNAVRDCLRLLGEPMTKFGEREMERRDRLRAILVDNHDQRQFLFENLSEINKEEEAVVSAATQEAKENISEYPFYTQGSISLLEARRKIAEYSIVKAALRINCAKKRRDDPDHDIGVDRCLKQVSNLRQIHEFRADRPISGCSFSHDTTMLAICSLSGVTKVICVPGAYKVVCTLKGHTERATDVAFSTTCNQLATASADRTAKLWSIDGNVIGKFEGHLDRLSRIAFHPSGMYLGTTSFDKTWRLWDVETNQELLQQEGHSRGVYGIAFHNDGSLAASCGLDSVARVWDLRSGKSIFALEGHAKPVLCASFSPNGYHLATGGEDNTCKIWDLRKINTLYTIPAHSNFISQVKFEPLEGNFFVTASFDQTANIWSSRDFKPVKTLFSHDNGVTAVDVSRCGQFVATVTYDRFISIYGVKMHTREGNGS